jgi:hypothetical protein
MVTAVHINQDLSEPFDQALNILLRRWVVSRYLEGLAKGHFVQF